MRQSSVITDKKGQGQQPVGLLGHAAVRPHPSHAVAAGMDSNMRTLTHDHEYNFASIPARTPAPGAPVNYATPACPAFPRRCPFGGACHACPVTVQAKLAINQPGDSYEQEADRMAERVMRMPESSIPATTASSTKSTPSAVPSIVHEVLRSPSQPLDAATRAFMEPRFGHDFSNVRIHTGGVAAESALALNAKAYTVGRDIVFGANRYAPRTTQGENLIAHELTHVIQQNNIPALQTIQRRLIVEGPNDPLPGMPPKVARDDVRDYVRDLSPSFDVTAAASIEPVAATHCTATTRFTDRCLCDLHRSTNAVPWKIKIDDIAWPHTEEANRRVTVHSTRSVIEFGAWGGGAQAGQRITQSNARVLGHELCGHAWLMEQGIHPPFVPSVTGGRLMGRPSHDVTVMIENRVAQDMSGAGADRRGTFSDPHHGESFARITVSDFPTGSTSVSALPADMQARLIRVRDAMAKDPAIRADVIGYADRIGGAATNADISRRRAFAVRNHVVGMGIPASRFRAVLGKSYTECPPAPADNPSCRKAEVFLFIFEAASETSPV